MEGPTRLIVEDYEGGDISNVALHSATLEKLDLFQGDYVMLKGKRKHMTVAVVTTDDGLPENAVRITKMMRKNLKVHLSDLISIKRHEVPFGNRVQILPYADTVEGITGNLFEAYLVPHFRNAYRPVHEGDRFIVNANMHPVEFKVVRTDPESCCVVAPQTEIFCDGEPINRDDDEEADEIGYEDVGGMSKQLALIREAVELPLRHPELFTAIGAKPPRGILLSGPPGTGKTLIARAVANETGAFFFLLNAPEIMSRVAGDSEANLRKAFEEAEKNAPSIIFIDEIDAVATKRDETHGEVEKRIVSQLLVLMDGLKSRANVIVLAATNRPDSLDPALRRFGRFDREINIGVPDTAGRLEIMHIHTRKMRLAPDVDLAQIASETHGFVGADLAAVCTESGLACIRDKLDLIDMEQEGGLDAELLATLAVSQAHFRQALSQANPSALRENAVEVPNVQWTDIGGLENVKDELKELIINPLVFPRLYETAGIRPGRGVLFYGPPGTGKTLLAKAVATESAANFISVKGPELLSKWFGESEQNVRILFNRARQAAPCVLFFDEIDSIGMKRSSGGGYGSEASSRILNQLLTELDGLESRKQVIVLAATNRPDLLDPALMRPGRFDQAVLIPLADFDSRISIMKAHFRKSTLDFSKANMTEDAGIAEIARRTEGWSGADLAEICQTAGRLAVRRAVKTIVARRRAAGIEEDNADAELNEEEEDVKLAALHWEDVERAFRACRSSVPPGEMARYETFRREMGGGLAADVEQQAVSGAETPAATTTGEGKRYAGSADDDDDAFYQ